MGRTFYFCYWNNYNKRPVLQFWKMCLLNLDGQFLLQTSDGCVMQFCCSHQTVSLFSVGEIRKWFSSLAMTLSIVYPKWIIIIQSMFKPPNCSIMFQYLNQVILWDRIIRRGENAVLDLTEMNCKYYFFDDGAGLR